MNRLQFLAMLGAGFCIGLLSFAGVWLSDPDQGQFMRLMKLVFGLFFLVHLGVYFLFDPSFSISHGLYWFIFMAFGAMVFCSYIFHRSKKAVRWVDKLKHQLWEKKLLVVR
jgi:hypothetical protein